MSYLNSDNCHLSLKHYEVLHKLTSDWEEAYWARRAESADLELTDDARYWLSFMLLGRLNVLFANTIDYLYRKELGALNPLLKTNPDLAPTRLRDEASGSLDAKLQDDPELLFEGKEALRGRYDQLVKQHSDAVDEMIDRIANDKDAIAANFFEGRSFTRITYLNAELGDCHFGGRRTTVVGTDRGKFLYKPRSLRGDVTMRGLVDEFFPDTLVVPRALDRGAYGYSEFIESRRAEGAEEARAFFRRLGGTSAVMHMLGSNDLHVENMLSRGTHPALVDLETALVPVVMGADMGYPQDSDYLKTCEDIDISLLRSGLLPRRVNGKEYSPCLSSDARSILPVVDGRVRTVLDYLAEFEEGFRRSYDICLERKAELKMALQGFSEAPMRLLLRNTDAYAQLQQRLYAVSALSSHEVTQRLCDGVRMRLPYLTDGQNDAAANAERESLADGDIPYFNLLGGSRDLCSGKKVVARQVFSKSPIENATLHLDRMSEAEREFELALVRSSLDFAIIEDDSRPADFSVERVGFSEEDYAAEARDILRSIQEGCIKAPSGNYVWFGMVNERGTFGHLPPGFSMGCLGIALFCAEYFTLFGDESARETAQRAAHSAVSLTSLMIRNPDKIPEMNIPLHLGDAIRMFLRLGDLLHDGRYIDLAKELVASLPTFPEEAIGSLDYYSGAAGLLYALCIDGRLSSCSGFDMTARRLGDRLLEHQTLEFGGDRRGWDTLGLGRAVSGLGHGQVGIGLALYMAHLALGGDCYKRSAEDALKIEQELYSEKIGNWPDFRQSSVGDATMNAICSGAPGMGLAYLKLYQHGLHDEYLEKAVDATLRSAPAYRDHLCCGNAGSVELLIEAGRVLRNDKLLKAADKRINWMLSRKIAKGTFRFLPKGYKNCEPFGIGFGLSGIGHTLLRRLSDGLETCML